MLQTASIIAGICFVVELFQFSNAQQPAIYGCPPRHLYDSTVKQCVSEITVDALLECPEGYEIESATSDICVQIINHQPLKSCADGASPSDDGSLCQISISTTPAETLCPSEYANAVHSDGSLGCIRTITSKKKNGCRQGYVFNLAEGCVKNSEEKVYWKCNQFGAVSRGRMCQFEQTADSVCPDGFEPAGSEYCRRKEETAGVASEKLETPRVCPKSFSPSATGCSRLRQIDAEPSCRSGAALVNSVTGPKCVRTTNRPLEAICPKDTAPCKENQDSCCAQEVVERTVKCKSNERYDQNTGKCAVFETTEVLLSCAQGNKLTMNGSDPVCVEKKTSAARKSCEEGELLDGKCTNRKTTEAVIQCPDGYKYSSESDICQQEYDGIWGRRRRRWHAARTERGKTSGHRLR